MYQVNVHVQHHYISTCAMFRDVSSAVVYMSAI